MKTFADRAIEFYSSLSIDTKLPAGVSILDPYTDTEVQNIIQSFFRKFYDDGMERIILFGINPGRFGAGVTGITFTDPERLEEVCGIPNSFEKRSELSSRFVYELIQAMGGAEKFFGRYYLSAVSPLGFVKSGKNLNYYDDKELEDSVKGFILSSLERQLDLGVMRNKAICLGEGKNFSYLQKLNKEKGIFKEIHALPHPRWVMQYRYRRKEEFIRLYRDMLNGI